MLLFGRVRQHRCTYPVVTACLLINLLLMVFYALSHSQKPLEEISPEDQKDDNGFPLFLHEPLENDQHRNSLKYPHKIRVNLSYGPKNKQRDLVSTKAENLQRQSRNNEHAVLDLDKREVRFQRNKLHVEEIERGHGLLLDEMSDNAQEVMKEIKEQVIPLKLLQQTHAPGHQEVSTKQPGFALGDTHGQVQLINQGDNQMPLVPEEADSIDADKIKVLFSPVTLCEDNIEVYLLIAVISDIRRYQLRNAIRNTWGRAAASGRFATKLVFVVAKPQEVESPLIEMILSENKHFGDIVYLDIEESHTMLTYKTLAMFQWTLEYCNQAKYVLKTDDDVFINLPNILQDLKVMEGKQPTRFMLGHVIDGAKPITDRNDKWFMPGGEFKGKTYPTYLSGSAYVLPSSVLEPLMQESRETKIFWLEDIYITGIIAKNIKATLVHNSKFEFRKRKLGPCRFKKLNSAHELSPDDLLFVWRELNRASLKCANTDGHFVKSLDYEYDP